jgi:hypothetical protein
MTKDLDRKHLLIVGGKRDDRHEFLNDLISGTNKQVYRLSPNLRTFDEYIEQARKLFPFVPTNWKEQNPKNWTRNQVWDFHLDWTENTHSILIIIEEFGEMEPNWKVEIIRHYIQTSYYQEGQNNGRLNFQLIVTQDKEDGLVDKIIPVFGLVDNEKRTEEQVILGKVKVINLDRA